MPNKPPSLQNLWLVSYSDFMTILMIFFLCMYGYAVMAKETVSKIQAANRMDLFSDMVMGLKKNLGDSVSFQESVNKLVVQLPEEILFKSAQASLPASSTAVDLLAESLKKTQGNIVVQGHTDDVPIVGGSFKSNWELSAARAFALIEALKQRGISEKRLSAWGFGEHRPVADNSDQKGRAKNRRIDIVILKGGTDVR